MPVSNPATLRSIASTIQGGNNFRNYLRSTKTAAGGTTYLYTYPYGTQPFNNRGNALSWPDSTTIIRLYTTGPYTDTDGKGQPTGYYFSSGGSAQNGAGSNLWCPTTGGNFGYEFSVQPYDSNYGNIYVAVVRGGTTVWSQNLAPGWSGTLQTGAVLPQITLGSDILFFRLDGLYLTYPPANCAGVRFYNLRAYRPATASPVPDPPGAMTPGNAENMGIATAYPLSMRTFAGATPPVTIPLTVTVSGSNFSVNNTPGTAGTISGSTTLTATPNGGTGTAAYVWTRQSGSTDLTISGSTATATVSISKSSSVATQQSYNAVFRCTVTKGTETAYFDISITATLTWSAVTLTYTENYPGDMTCSRTTAPPGTYDIVDSISNVAGGNGTYTYSWSRNGNSSITSAAVTGTTGASIQVRATESYANGSYSLFDGWNCYITDSFGNSVTVSRLFRWNLTVNYSLPANPSTLAIGGQSGGTGTANPQSATRVCSVNGYPGGSTFSWAVSGSGMTIQSGQGTSSITVACSNTATASPGTTYTGTVTCTVTSSGYQNGNLGSTNNISFTLVLTVQNISASISPASVYGSCARVTYSCQATTDVATVTVNGGSPPSGTTYTWSKVSGSTYTVVSAGAAATAFRLTAASDVDPGITYTAVYQCVVAAPGWNSATVQVNIQTEHVGGTTIDPNCPAPWVPLLMADKTSKPAGEIEVGDLVWAYNETLGEYGAYPVIFVERCQNIHWHLALSDNRAIVCAPNHRFYVNGGWKETRDIRPGDVIEGTNPGTVSEVGFEGEGDVMKITVDGAHTYVLSGLLSHNIKSGG